MRRISRRSPLIENLELRRMFAVAYTVTDLAPDTNGIVHTGRAYGMSNNGRVAMQYDGHAAVWFNGAVKDLGFNGYATDVNDNGVVCGVDTSEGFNRPFVYKEGVKTVLSFEGTTNGVANAINAAGTVVGTFNLSGTTRGFYAELGGSAHGIGLPSGATGIQATGINDNGQIVGNLQGSGGNRAFIKSSGTFKTIASLPGGEVSYIDHGLTNAGTLAVDGPSNDTVPGTNVKADRVYTVGSNGYGAPVNRGTLNVATHIHATDINASGVIVADVPDPGVDDSFAVRNLAGVGFDRLDNLVNAQLGWHFATAGAVNDSGAIVGTGNNGDSTPSPYLLTPIAVATAKINGRVFNDADSDGVRDTGEGNLSGVKVTLSKNGAIISTFTTGTSGEFGFAGLEAGTYVLAQTVLPGYVATAPATGTFTVTVANGQVVGEKFFGQHKTEVVPAKFSIRGRVWNDTDNDGVWDTPPEVASGVRTVFIDSNRNGVLDSGEKSTQSNAEGVYVFEGLVAGEYPVARVLPSGYHLTNGTNGKSYRIVNLTNASVDGVHLGSAANVEPVKTASITGVVFNDTDKDGLWDDGEERSGVRTVFIDTNGNRKLDDGEKSVQSNSEGRYTFSGLAAGTYRITRVFPSGYKLSNNNDGYVTITVTAGQTKTGVNLGSKPV